MSGKRQHKLLAEWLLRKRIERGLTQAELAALVRKPQSHISKIEIGERKVSVVELIELCSVLEADASEALDHIKQHWNRG